MRRTAVSFLGALILLQACTTTPRSRDAASPPPERAATPAAGAATPDVALERTYRSPVPLCVDAALRICREREIQVRQEERGEQAASLRGQGRSIDFSLAFSRSPAQRTRAVLRLQGRALPETREEALRLLDRLNEALLEPRD
jgi:hypothetical protein